MVAKKVNLIPSSYFLSKKLNVLQVVDVIISVIALLAVSAVAIAKIMEVNSLTEEVDTSNRIIAQADFKTRDQLKKRVEDLEAATDTGNFNNIPTKYEEMTEFITCIMTYKPETMTLTKVEGEFTGTGVYSYSFSFSAEDRATIPTFLENLQNEEILKYVNISAIELGEVTSGSATSTDPAAPQAWLFTLTIKSKGGAK